MKKASKVVKFICSIEINWHNEKIEEHNKEIKVYTEKLSKDRETEVMIQEIEAELKDYQVIFDNINRITGDSFNLKIKRRLANLEKEHRKVTKLIKNKESNIDFNKIGIKEYTEYITNIQKNAVEYKVISFNSFKEIRKGRAVCHHGGSPLYNGPGIYILFDKEDTPLFIGKSSNLKKRLRSNTLIQQHINEVSKVIAYYTDDYTQMLKIVVNEFKPKYNIKPERPSDTIQKYETRLIDYLTQQLTRPSTEFIRALFEGSEIKVDSEIAGLEESIIQVLYKFIQKNSIKKTE